MNNEKVNEDGNMKTFSHLDDDFSHFTPSLMSKALNRLKLRAKIEEEMPFVMIFALFGNLIKRCEGMAMGFNEFLVKKTILKVILYVQRENWLPKDSGNFQN